MPLDPGPFQPHVEPPLRMPGGEAPMPASPGEHRASCATREIDAEVRDKMHGHDRPHRAVALRRAEEERGSVQVDVLGVQAEG